jgi:molecular chaperone Hsp33
MPDASEDTLAELETNVRALPSASEMVRSGLRPDDILDQVLRGLGSTERRRVRPVFSCPCDRQRILRVVVALGRAEMRAIVEQREELEVCCEFCRERYEISADEVSALMAEA